MKTAMRLIALAILSVTAATWAQAQSTEGIKETERFIKTGGATSQSVAEARLKTQKALDAYNAITLGDSEGHEGRLQEASERAKRHEQPGGGCAEKDR